LFHTHWWWVQAKMRIVRASAAPLAAPVAMSPRSNAIAQMEDVLDDPPEQLLGVNVRWLADALSNADVTSTEDVTRELYQGHRFLQRVVTTDGRLMGKLAIISYRCERVESDEFTLDAAALRASVQAAQAAEVDYLWLDAWAYRKQPRVWDPSNRRRLPSPLLSVLPLLPLASPLTR